MHRHTYTHANTCTRVHIHTHMHIQHVCMSVHIHTNAYLHTHIQYVHMHTRKHAWNDVTAVTVQGADADAGSSSHFFCSMQLTTFSTTNARTSLFPLPETPIPLYHPSPLPNIPQNSSLSEASAVLLFHTDTKTECTTSKKFCATSQWPFV